MRNGPINFLNLPIVKLVILYSDRLEFFRQGLGSDVFVNDVFLCKNDLFYIVFINLFFSPIDENFRRATALIVHVY